MKNNESSDDKTQTLPRNFTRKTWKQPIPAMFLKHEFLPGPFNKSSAAYGIELHWYALSNKVNIAKGHYICIQNIITKTHTSKGVIFICLSDSLNEM